MEQMRRLRVVSEPNPSYNPPGRLEGPVTQDKLFLAFREHFKTSTVEEVIVVALDSELYCLGYTVVARGTVNHAPVSLRDCLQFVILCNAAQWMLIHNHPNDRAPIPSENDSKFTAKALTFSEMMNCTLADSMIMSEKGYFSFVQIEHHRPGSTPFRGREIGKP